MGVLNYLKDDDLEFLSRCTKEELAPLVQIITRDADDALRDSEDLTLQPEYQKHKPNHPKYWHLIAADYQYFGGNTIANGFRGHGVPYHEILRDVCKQMKIRPLSSRVAVNEEKLLAAVFEQLIEGLSAAEAEALVQQLSLPTKGVGKAAMVLALQTAVRAGGFASYQLTVIVANAMARQLVGHGLSFAANASLTRGLAMLAGPVGMIISGLFTVISLAGPGYRVTVPATIYLALLRKLKETPHCPHCDAVTQQGARFCAQCGASLS